MSAALVLAVALEVWAGVGAVLAIRWAWRGWKRAGQVIKDAERTGDGDERCSGPPLA